MSIIQLTDHFALHEFACHCRYGIGNCGGAVVVPPIDFLMELEWLRQNTGPIIINSGYRCYNHNKFVGGTKMSFHTMFEDRFAKYGASDIRCPELMNAWGFTWLDIVKDLLDHTRLVGIIIHEGNGELSQSYIHVDGRGEPYFKREKK